MKSPPAKVVIFDLDGTLVDSLPATFLCFQEALEPALGRRPSVDEIRARFGPADHRILADWVGPEGASDAVERLYACYERELGAAGLFPGLSSLLRDLRDRGCRLGLFTGRGRPSTDRILATLGVARLFEATVTGDEVEHPKPAPDGIVKILDVLGAPPEIAVYVGDSALDVEAAQRAGVGCITVAWATSREALPEWGEERVATVARLRRRLLPL